MAVKLFIQAGVTLIELVIVIVVMGLAMSGILLVINLTNSHSANPVIQQQGLRVAEAYLEEVQLQAYTDPDGSNVGETRATFDNVDDYQGLYDNGVNSPQGATLAGLNAYRVRVAVDNQAVIGINAKKITVTVSPPSISDIVLVGYKFNG